MQLDSADAAIEHLWQTRPEDMCKMGDRIAHNLRCRKECEAPQKRYAGPYPDAFYPPREWDPDTHALLLVGPAGLGKTQFARYLLGDCDYVKGSLETLRECEFDKPILFDEVNMLDADPEQSKEVTDVENGGSIKIRYKDVTIPPGVRRVFVHNIEHPFRNPSGAVYGRRLVTHVISGPIAAAQAAVIEAEKAAASAAAAASLASYAVSHCLSGLRRGARTIWRRGARTSVPAPDNTRADEHGDGETQDQEQLDRRRVECDRIREETEKRRRVAKAKNMAGGHFKLRKLQQDRRHSFGHTV